MVDQQSNIEQRIDETLKRCFKPPDLQRLTQLLPSTPRQADVVARPWRGRVALAAGFVAAICGGWLIWDAASPRFGADPYTPAPWRSFETVWHDEAGGAMKPRWRCENDAEFQAAFLERLGQPLLLAELPTGLEALGLSYCHSLSAGTIYLLARSDGEPVLVFADRFERDRLTDPPAGTGLRRWRRQIGGIVLYEVSGLEQSVLLDRFYDPESGDGNPAGG